MWPSVPLTLACVRIKQKDLTGPAKDILLSETPAKVISLLKAIVLYWDKGQTWGKSDVCLSDTKNAIIIQIIKNLMPFWDNLLLKVATVISLMQALTVSWMGTIVL